MLRSNSELTGKSLLEMAHAASHDGFDAYAHVDGFEPLAVRTVDAIGSHTTFATVRCWTNDEGKAEVWLVPLAAVRGVQIHGEWPC